MKTVIKFAGALLEDDATMRSLARQVAALANQGHEILVVHGGGHAFTEALKRMGIESKFVSGLRVTDRETRDAAVMIFAGLLNKRLAAAISAEPVTHPAAGGNSDFGRSGAQRRGSRQRGSGRLLCGLGRRDHRVRRQRRSSRLDGATATSLRTAQIPASDAK